jgi:hypothetical protein
MQGASSVWSILNVFFADERFWLGDQMLWNSNVPRGTFSLAAAERVWKARFEKSQDAVVSTK